jgi:hypothetical protein
MSRIDALILVVLALIGLGWLATERGWPGSRLLRRLVPPVRGYVRRAPATFIYGAILFVTTWVVAGVGRRVSDEVLRSQSTNLHNLRAHPVSALLRSMFWSGTTVVVPVLALLVMVLAPAEMWLGTKRLIPAFLTGHIGATLITAYLISRGYFSASATAIDRDIDVGISYGTLCVAGVLTYRLPRRWRILYAVVLLGVFAALAFEAGRTYTDLGHLVSIVIGLALYPFVRGRPAGERFPIPIPLGRRRKAAT